MRTHAPLLVLCALSLAPALVAHAADTPVVYKPCDKKPSADDTEAAKGLFSAGKVSYNEGDYAKAISLWRDAFERDCTANPLLQNLANAYEKAGNLDASIVTLETFLKRDPQNSEAPTIQKRIENMKKAKAAAAATATTSAPAATTAPTATTPPTQPSTTASVSLTDGSRPMLPLYVAGGSGIVAILGGAIYLNATSKYNDYKDKIAAAKAAKDTQLASSLAKDGNKTITTQHIGSAVGIVGLVGVAGGLTWYFLSKPEQKAARVLVPELSPGYAGFSMGGRF